MAISVPNRTDGEDRPTGGNTGQELYSEEHFLESGDGTRLFYRMWRRSCTTGKALILFHRGHEHSGRWQHIVGELGDDDTTVFAWDARGHGRSAGPRGYADSFMSLVRDIDAFIAHISREHHIPVENMILVGNSISSVAVSAWVHDYAPGVRGLVLSAPAFRVNLLVPFALPVLRLLARINHKASIKSYVSGKWLTRDRDQSRAYDSDPLIAREIGVKVLVEMHDTARRIIDDAGAITTPTLILSAGDDWIVSRRHQRQFFANLGSTNKQLLDLPGFRHAIFHELERDKIVETVRTFLDSLFDSAEPEADGRQQAVAPHMLALYKELLKPLPWWRPRWLPYALTRATLQTIGRLSQGIAIGWKHGFDSGLSLDYIYRNEQEGITALGRLFDRLYLDTAGWRGIRRRSVNLKKLLLRALGESRTREGSVRIIDIAAGGGRYVLETISQLRPMPVSAVLCDLSEEGLTQASHLAQTLDLPDVCVLARDAFSVEPVAGLPEKFDVGIVSGLYELFADNPMVDRSLGSLRFMIRPGGFLIYTNQPWHPQLELIARTLINRDGQPWVMRLRSQAEMDALVAAHGFEKLAMEIDNEGIFTVSLARAISRA